MAHPVRRGLRPAARGVLILLVFLAMPVPAQEPTPDQPKALPAATEQDAPDPVTAPRQRLAGRHGYAFDQPDILLRQRLVGLAHGLRLLGKACLFVPEFSRAGEEAYGRWYRQQGAALDALTRDLEQWYYGSIAPGLDTPERVRDLVRLLGLPVDLRAMPAEELNAACASYAEAIAGERYDFVRLLESEAQERAAEKTREPADATSVLPSHSASAGTEPAAGGDAGRAPDGAPSRRESAPGSDPEFTATPLNTPTLPDHHDP